jgi:hypothetical protein
MSNNDRVIASGDEKELRIASAQRTRRSFLVGVAVAIAGYGAVRWIDNGPDDHHLQVALRRTLNFDADVSRSVFREHGLAPTFHPSQAKPLRLNGIVGLDKVLPASGWRLQLAGVANPQNYSQYRKDVTSWEYGYGGDMGTSETVPDMKNAPASGDAGQTVVPSKPNTLNPEGAANTAAADAIAARFEALARQTSKADKKRVEGTGDAGASASGLNIGTPGLLLSMDDITKLPSVELVTEFKCIEGWSSVTQWGGVRLRDLIDAYPPQPINGHEPRYVYMETPDGNYYCGYDMAAARHPQSLLVTEMGGQPLAQEHGAPLRLHMPIKYGYKQIKRIGLIAYTNTKPDDFWAKLGYDWYAGL